MEPWHRSVPKRVSSVFLQLCSGLATIEFARQIRGFTERSIGFPRAENTNFLCRRSGTSCIHSSARALTRCFWPLVRSSFIGDCRPSSVLRFSATPTRIHKVQYAQSLRGSPPLLSALFHLCVISLRPTILDHRHARKRGMDSPPRSRCPLVFIHTASHNRCRLASRSRSYGGPDRLSHILISGA